MKQLLLNERWRPKKMEDLVLLPRIQKFFPNGEITANYVFYGTPGTGKTSLARILIGKYSKDKPYLELNNSYYSSIDDLRTKVDDYCSKDYTGIDLDAEINKDEIKYVFLDEFERSSIQYQDALKVYIEDFSNKNVRFIFNTNNINKVSDGIKSRMTCINFNTTNGEEEKFLKNSLYKRIMNEICVKEEIEINKENLVRLINRNFPDFRSILNGLQQFKLTGEITSNNSVNAKLKTDLYNVVFSNMDYEQIYHFVMDNFGQDNIDEMFQLFSRDFINWIFNEKRENVNKLFEVNYIVSEYHKLLDTNTDPVVVGMTLIGKLKDLFK